jgi:hypothetical protein
MHACHKGYNTVQAIVVQGFKAQRFVEMVYVVNMNIHAAEILAYSGLYMGTSRGLQTPVHGVHGDEEEVAYMLHRYAQRLILKSTYLQQYIVAETLVKLFNLVLSVESYCNFRECGCAVPSSVLV